MSYISELEAEEQALCDEINSGQIDEEEFNRRMRELHDDFDSLMRELEIEP